MWNFIKKSISILGLFIILVLLVGLYSSLVQEPANENKKENSSETLPDSSTTTTTTTDNATSSDFIDVGSDEPIIEDIPTY